MSDGGRLDRELEELLQELRVALPGVQVLFAFLLVVPFNSRYADITSYERGVYAFALIAAACACVLLLAPTAFHRLRWRQYDKVKLLEYSNRLVILGMVVLAMAMVSSVLFVFDFVFGAGMAIVGAGIVALGCLALWFGVPMRRRSRDESERSVQSPAERAAAR